MPLGNNQVLMMSFCRFKECGGELDCITAFIEEDKNTTFREWIHSELKIHHRNKTLGLFSKVRGTDRQEYIFCITGETAQHNFCSFSSNSAAGFTE